MKDWKKIVNFNSVHIIKILGKLHGCVCNVSRNIMYYIVMAEECCKYLSSCNAGYPGLIPGSARSSGEGKGFLIPWTEEPGGLQSIGLQTVMLD